MVLISSLWLGLAAPAAAAYPAPEVPRDHLSRVGLYDPDRVRPAEPPVIVRMGTPVYMVLDVTTPAPARVAPTAPPFWVQLGLLLIGAAMVWGLGGMVMAAGRD